MTKYDRALKCLRRWQGKREAFEFHRLNENQAAKLDLVQIAIVLPGVGSGVYWVSTRAQKELIQIWYGETTQTGFMSPEQDL